MKTWIILLVLWLLLLAFMLIRSVNHGYANPLLFVAALTNIVACLRWIIKGRKQKS